MPDATSNRRPSKHPANTPKIVAFYLPQYHRTEENDCWWGPGFTDWTNVRRAVPQFAGHLQPREAADLGEYSLDSSEPLHAQTALARRYGIDAFCIYYYWFGGRRLLSAPVEAWRKDASLLPYCLSWANETWTRRWDGKSREVLIRQDYFSGFERELFDDLLPHLRAPHYLRHSGKPVLLVHRVDEIPDAGALARRLRGMAAERDFGLHLVAAETKPGIDPRRYGFDALAEFPPVGSNTLAAAHVRPLEAVAPTFRGRLMSYEKLARTYMERPRVDFQRYPGVVPGWDNTPRRMSNATIYIGESPEKFGQWLAHAVSTQRSLAAGEGYVFINAWNEWAEGAYLEPDASTGLRKLEQVALSKQPSRPTQGVSKAGSLSIRSMSLPQLRSIFLAAAGSALARARVARSAIAAARRPRSSSSPR